MTSRGTLETDQLRSNLQSQLDRLVNELSDLESVKDDLSEEEYSQSRQDVLDQLEEFKKTLTKVSAGDLSLVDDLNAMQLAIQAAISQAFKTPEVMRLFARKEPDGLRNKLTQLERDVKIGLISRDKFISLKAEILVALRNLSEPLEPEQEDFLKNQSNIT